MYRWGHLSLPVFLLAALLRPTAQPQASLSVSQPDIQAFPTISLLVGITDDAGRRIPGLEADSFQVLEDGGPVEDLAVEEVLVGTRQVFVINTSPGLSVRDSHGRSRFDFARDELIRYWQEPEASLTGVDDLSLLTADGLLIQHSSAAAELSSALASADPSFEGIISGFDLLLLALDFSADPAEAAALPSSLIFITPLIETPGDLPLANAVSRANESGTAVFPILFASQEGLELPEAEPFRELAQKTGGQFLAFDPEQGMGELTDRILDQRYQYRLTFSSQADEPGTHQLVIQLRDGNLQAESPQIAYEIDVRPPEVAFIQAPAEILRQTEDPDMDSQAIPPTAWALRLLTTYPDGHPRNIVRSTLLVDKEVVERRREPPFDQFEWDISRYGQSDTHIVSAIVEDSLGLVATTIDHPVEVVVSRPDEGIAALRPALDSLVAILAIIVAGMVLVIGLTTLVRRAPLPEPAAGVHLNPIKRTRLQSTAPPEALLVPLRPSGDAIPLTGVDVVLGRDASLSAIVLDDPSVERMHARLIRQAGGDFLLRDQDSVAGSWVNYDLVPSQGTRLRHGDHIQLGRVEFRFQLPGKHQPRPIRVYPDNPSNAEPRE